MQTATAHSHESHAPGELQVHAVSPRILLTVFGALLVLTLVTVGVTYFDFGDFNIWVALGIAVIKASLVALYFMHLRWDSLFNGVIFISALLFLAIFIGAAITDTSEYKPNLTAPGNNLAASK